MAKLPTIKDLTELVRHVKKQIAPEYLAFEGDETPGICLTVGANLDEGSWSWQTGDNSYTGGAYGYPVWAVVGIYRNSNSRELAREIRAQLEESW